MNALAANKNWISLEDAISSPLKGCALTEPNAHVDEYDEAMVALLELVWGKGFMAPGGPENVRRILAGLNVQGKYILDIGSGLGGGDIVLAEEFGAKVMGIDLEEPLISKAKSYVDEAGLDKQIEFRHVTAGKLPFPDETFDIVYSSGAFTQTEDKIAIFAEARRVLRSGGNIASYDWMGIDQPYSADMLRWFELEGLTYALQSMEAHHRLLEEAGFSDIEVEDDGGWYSREARREYELLLGPMKKEALHLLGADQYQHFIDDWQALIKVLEGGELKPAYFRGHKKAL